MKRLLHLRRLRSSLRISDPRVRQYVAIYLNLYNAAVLISLPILAFAPWGWVAVASLVLTGLTFWFTRWLYGN